jgi:hypothetical protein
MNRKNLLILAMAFLFLVSGSIMALAAEGAANFVVAKPLYVGGNQIQPGSYFVKWETKNTDATVIFVTGGKEVAKVQAKCVELNQKNDRNSLMTGQDASGRDTIKQIQFAGKNLRITFE